MLLALSVAGYMTTEEASSDSDACAYDEKKPDDAGYSAMLLLMLMSVIAVLMGVIIGMLCERSHWAQMRQSQPDGYVQLESTRARDDGDDGALDDQPADEPVGYQGPAQAPAVAETEAQRSRRPWPELVVCRYGDCYHLAECECVTTSRNATRTMRPCKKCLG